MKFQGSVIKEQGVTFAIVIVKQTILNNKQEADNLIREFKVELFRGIPVILMAQDLHGIPTYYGRKDISKYMAKVPIDRVPWKEYTVN